MKVSCIGEVVFFRSINEGNEDFIGKDGFFLGE